MTVNNTNDIMIEDPHCELDEGSARIYLNNKNKIDEYLEKWHVIKDSKCYKWNWEDSDLLFKPIYKVIRERELEKNINIEFSKVKTFQHG